MTPTLEVVSDGNAKMMILNNEFKGKAYNSHALLKAYKLFGFVLLKGKKRYYLAQSKRLKIKEIAQCLFKPASLLQ